MWTFPSSMPWLASCITYGCTYPPYRDRLCRPCWDEARAKGRDPKSIAAASVGGRAAEPMTPDWDAMSAEAQRQGVSVCDLILRVPQR